MGEETRMHIRRSTALTLSAASVLAVGAFGPIASATTVPPGATVAPVTDATDARPSGPVGSQDVAVPVLVRATSRPSAVVPVTTKP